MLGVGPIGVELSFGDGLFGFGIGRLGFVLLGQFLVVFLFEVIEVGVVSLAKIIFLNVDVSFFDGIEEVVWHRALRVGIEEGGSFLVVDLIGDGVACSGSGSGAEREGFRV